LDDLFATFDIAKFGHKKFTNLIEGNTVELSINADSLASESVAFARRKRRDMGTTLDTRSIEESKTCSIGSSKSDAFDFPLRKMCRNPIPGLESLAGA
jgi:hypothetical protein